MTRNIDERDKERIITVQQENKGRKGVGLYILQQH